MIHRHLVHRHVHLVLYAIDVIPHISNNFGIRKQASVFPSYSLSEIGLRQKKTKNEQFLFAQEGSKAISHRQKQGN